MKAKMIKDDYIDIVSGYEYEVEKVFSPSYGYIKLKNSPRRYDINSFEITHNGKVISHAEAYRRYKYESVLKKVGVK